VKPDAVSPLVASANQTGPPLPAEWTDADTLALMQRTSVGAVVRRAGPRLVRDAFGPLAVFFAAWKLIGLTAGVGLAAAFGAAVFVNERRRGRPAVVVRIALILVAVRASVGLSSGSATAYLAQEIGIDTLLGCTVLASLATRRPFASWFVDEIVPLPKELRDSETFRRAMRTITAVWGAYFLGRALVRLAALLTLSTDRFALVIALTDVPFLIALLAWSVYYAARVVRESPLWAPVIAAAEASRTERPSVSA
jgi:intracellular septation protein A